MHLTRRTNALDEFEFGGAIYGTILTALEPRFKGSILAAGGFPTQSLPPEANPINFAPRAKMPILVLNGLLDFLVPLQGAQEPMFRVLGAPQVDAAIVNGFLDLIGKRSF